MIRYRTTPAGRTGFSLLEVLVALTIFLFGIIAIGQLITLGSDRALEVQFQAQAVQLCQAKMAEVIAGAVPLSSQADAKFDEDPDWSWSLEAEQDSNSSLLWNVKVTVTHPRPDGSKMEASLSQMVLDPSQRGSATDAALTASASANSPDSSSSSSSGSNASSGGMNQSSGMTGAAASPMAGGVAAPPTSSKAPTSNSTAPGTSRPSTTPTAPTAPSVNTNKTSTTKGGKSP
jgi:general secretion pathway protein I